MDLRLLTLSQFAAVVVGNTISKALLVPTSTVKWWEEECLPIFEKDLGDNNFINGNSFSLTDIYLCFSIGHAFHAGLLKNASKKIVDYYQRISKRAKFKKAFDGALFSFFIDEK